MHRIPLQLSASISAQKNKNKNFHPKHDGFTREPAGSPKQLPDRAHHSDSHYTQVTSCKPHLELPVLTLSGLCFIHGTIIDPPSLQLSDRMSSRCQHTGSALVSASSHIHEDLKSHSRGSLKTPSRWLLAAPKTSLIQTLLSKQCFRYTGCTKGFK